MTAGATANTRAIDADLAPRLRLAITRTARRLRQEASSDLGPSQLASLATIERHGPLAPGELAQRERIEPPTATRIVGHLEQAGLVERMRDPSDGRSSILSITAAGRTLLRRVRARKTAYLAKNLHELDSDDVAALERAADVLERMLEQHPTAEHRVLAAGGPQ
jgi:DNA-binding MarR family transcriptional regulator